MLYGYGVLFAVEMVLLVFCVLDVVVTPEAQVRNLPKLVWLLLVVLLPLAGGIAWLVAGRPQGGRQSLPYKGNTGRLPAEYDRPGRATAHAPDDDAAFLQGLKARADAQRAAAEQERRRRREAEEAQEQRDREARRLRGPGDGGPGAG